jgi:hypothetical protein
MENNKDLLKKLIAVVEKQQKAINKLAQMMGAAQSNGLQAFSKWEEAFNKLKSDPSAKELAQIEFLNGILNNKDGKWVLMGTVKPTQSFPQDFLDNNFLNIFKQKAQEAATSAGLGTLGFELIQSSK